MRWLLAAGGRGGAVLYRCLLEARPAVQGVFALRFLAGASFSETIFAIDLAYTLWAGVAICVCTTLSVYLLNGIMDVEEDRANGSPRPVARGKVTTVQAAVTSGALALLGVAGGYVLGGSMVWSVIGALVLGWLYSGPPLYLKRRPAGLATVAILAALITYQAGYAANRGSGGISSLIVFAAAMAVWMGLVGQTKDLSDIEGDKQAGRKSGPVAWGEDVARLIYSRAALCLGGGYLLWALLFATDLLVSAVVLATGAVGVAVLALGPWSRGDRSRRRRPYRAFMLTQYGANLAVIISRDEA